MKKFQFTQEGFEKIKGEHKDLSDKKRPEAVKRLAAARAMGDLSENSEYTASVEDLNFIEGRLLELEQVIKNAVIIQQTDIKASAIDVGSSVVVDKDGKEIVFMIVGEFEADPLQNKLSHTSPLGKALVGKKKGEKVKVAVPAGEIVYTILEIK